MPEARRPAGRSVVAGKERRDRIVDLGRPLVRPHRPVVLVGILVVALDTCLRDLGHAPLVLGKRSFEVSAAHPADTRRSPDRMQAARIRARDDFGVAGPSQVTRRPARDPWRHHDGTNRRRSACGVRYLGGRRPSVRGERKYD